MPIKIVITYPIIAFIGIVLSLILPNYSHTKFSQLQSAIAKQVTFPMPSLESKVYLAIQKHRHINKLPGLNNSIELSRIARNHSKLTLENNGSIGQSEPEFDNLHNRYQEVSIVETWIDCQANDSQAWITEQSNETNFNGIGIGIVRNPRQQCYMTKIFVKS